MIRDARVKSSIIFSIISSFFVVVKLFFILLPHFGNG